MLSLFAVRKSLVSPTFMLAIRFVLGIEEATTLGPDYEAGLSGKWIGYQTESLGRMAYRRDLGWPPTEAS